MCLTGSVLLKTSQLVADDVTMARQLGHDYMNSDIDFIHGDIHKRLCTNEQF